MGPINMTMIKPNLAGAFPVKFLSQKASLPALAQAEYLEVDNQGGSSAGTFIGNKTRCYHGVLVQSQVPPVDRRVRVSHLEEIMETADGKQFPLSVSHKGGDDIAAKNKSVTLLQHCTVLPVPTWIYQLPNGQGQLKKQQAMRKDQGKVVVGYTLSPDAKAPISLKISPFVNERDIHSMSTSTWEWTQEATPQGVVVKSGGVNPQYIRWQSSHPSGAKITYTPSPEWKGNFFHQREADRHLCTTENNFTPGVLSITLRPGEQVNLFMATKPIESTEWGVNKVARAKAQHLQKMIQRTGLPDTDTNRLLFRAADQFIVHRQSVNGPTIIAGYHWFADWGRDTMIALPGLTLSTRRFKDAQGILTTFAKYVKNGMLPNNFPESSHNEPGYNTLDASMWWFHAVDAYRKTIAMETQTPIETRQTYRFLKGQYEKLQEVVTHHLYGRHSGDELIALNPALAPITEAGHTKLPVGSGQDGIGMESDGLIAANNPQLTWMDAATSNEVFTPRGGKPIEINALWYNGLNVMADLATTLEAYEQQHNPGHRSAAVLSSNLKRYAADIQRYHHLAGVVKTSMQKYWNPEKQDLNDLLDSPEPWRGAQIRPNQIFALSLPYRAFDAEKERAVLKTVETHLLTPYGLRSLSPEDKDYAHYYPNDIQYNRDKVYHQGAVWSWLIGPYLDAYLNINGRDEGTRGKALEKLRPLLNHLEGKIPEHIASGAALGGISEIFDGDAPHYAKGTVNQAWSVAEVLRHIVDLTGKQTA